MGRPDAAVVLFTLSPQHEGVRKPLGLGAPERAVRVFKTLIDHTASLCRGVAGVDLLISTPGPEPIPKRGAHYLPQRGNDFGSSLKLAVDDAFALGYRRVVVIGNDAPELTESYLADAFESLATEGAAAVLGPAEDGGYNLLGLTAPCPAAFETIPWGTPRVCEITRDRLRAMGFEVSVLASLADLDTPSALARFLARTLGGGRRVPPRLCRLARQLKALFGSPNWIAPPPRTYRAVLTSSYTLRGPPIPAR